MPDPFATPIFVTDDGDPEGVLLAERTLEQEIKKNSYRHEQAFQPTSVGLERAETSSRPITSVGKPPAVEPSELTSPESELQEHIVAEIFRAIDQKIQQNPTLTRIEALSAVAGDARERLRAKLATRKGANNPRSAGDRDTQTQRPSSES